MTLQETSQSSHMAEHGSHPHAFRDRLPESYRESYDALLAEYDTIRAGYGDRAIEELPSIAEKSLSGVVNRPPYTTQVREGIEKRTQRFYTSVADAHRYGMTPTLEKFITEYDLTPKTRHQGDSLSPAERRDNDEKAVVVNELEKHAYDFLKNYQLQLEPRVRKAYVDQRKDGFVGMLKVRHTDDITALAREDFDAHFEKTFDTLRDSLQTSQGKKMGGILLRRNKTTHAASQEQPVHEALMGFEAEVNKLRAGGLLRTSEIKVQNFIDSRLGSDVKPEDVRSVLDAELRNIGEEITMNAFGDQLRKHLEITVISQLKLKGLLPSIAPVEHYQPDTVKGVVNAHYQALLAKGYNPSQAYNRLMREYHPDKLENPDDKAIQSSQEKIAALQIIAGK